MYKLHDFNHLFARSFRLRRMEQWTTIPRENKWLKLNVLEKVEKLLPNVLAYKRNAYLRFFERKAPMLRCQTPPSIRALGGHQPVIPRVPLIRWARALPHGTPGSLWPTFVSAWRVRLTVRQTYAIMLNNWFPTSLSLPSHTSVTLWEVTAPVKLPTMQCSNALFVVRSSLFSTKSKIKVERANDIPLVRK